MTKAATRAALLASLTLAGLSLLACEREPEPQTEIVDDILEEEDRALEDLRHDLEVDLDSE